jgi:hypothetical protein
VNKISNSTPSGGSNEETTATLPASQSSNEVSPSTLDTSATTPKAKNLKGSQAMPNLQDAPNAARLIQALAGKLGSLVEWKKLTLGNGHEVYALCFPIRKWQVDPESKELLPRVGEL